MLCKTYKGILNLKNGMWSLEGYVKLVSVCQKKYDGISNLEGYAELRRSMSNFEVYVKLRRVCQA